MTYRSRGRSIVELVVAVTFVGFIVGFVAVLCVGNYYRAKRAMERQRERRLARRSGAGIDDGSLVGSSVASPTSSEGIGPGDESRHLLSHRTNRGSGGGGHDRHRPGMFPFSVGGGNQKSRHEDILLGHENHSLLLHEERPGAMGSHQNGAKSSSDVMSV